MNLSNKEYFELHCYEDNNIENLNLKECFNSKILNVIRYDTRDKINIKLENNKNILVKIKKDMPLNCLEDVAKTIEKYYLQNNLNKDLLERDFCSAERIG